MRRAIAVLPAGAASNLRCVDTLLLDYDQRQRLHGSHRALRGTEVEMALAQAVPLQTDDRLILDDETLIEIVARPEPLYELRAASSFDLARIAWMLGDRHCPAEISERHLRVRRDTAIEALLVNAPVKILAIEAPFEPEGGAYSHSRARSADAAAHECAHSEHHEHDR
jgi:urease accessory protein